MSSALESAITGATYLSKIDQAASPSKYDLANYGRAALHVGAEIPNQLQAVTEAIDALEASTRGEGTPSCAELLRDARTGLANVLEIAKRLRGER